jgi:hypothetical protein
MTTTLPARPDASEYAPYFHKYVSLLPDGDIRAQLRSSGRELVELLARVPEERGGHRYAPEKWSIREVVGHLIDGERIFTYRALRIARGDQTPLPPFDENAYVETAGSDARTLSDLVRELAAVRESSALLFDSLPADAWERRGVMSGNGVSVRALAYITAGHAIHHLRLLRERYGVS